jgi:hypothetical protein
MVERIAATAKLGFKGHAHMLRHACAFKLANDGVDTRSLQAYLGTSQYPEYDAIYAARAGSVQGFLAGLITGNGPKLSLPTRKPPLVGSYAFFEDLERLSRDDMLRMSLHGSYRCNGLSLGSGGGLFGDHACRFGFHQSATGC